MQQPAEEPPTVATCWKASIWRYAAEDEEEDAAAGPTGWLSLLLALLRLLRRLRMWMR